MQYIIIIIIIIIKVLFIGFLQSLADTSISRIRDDNKSSMKITKFENCALLNYQNLKFLIQIYEKHPQ